MSSVRLPRYPFPSTSVTPSFSSSSASAPSCSRVRRSRAVTRAPIAGKLLIRGRLLPPIPQNATRLPRRERANASAFSFTYAISVSRLPRRRGSAAQAGRAISPPCEKFLFYYMAFPGKYQVRPGDFPSCSGFPAPSAVPLLSLCPKTGIAFRLDLRYDKRMHLFTLASTNRCKALKRKNGLQAVRRCRNVFSKGD